MIYLHLDHNDAKKIHDDKLKGNLIVLGHLAGDSKGLNALADRLGFGGWRLSDPDWPRVSCKIKKFRFAY